MTNDLRINLSQPGNYERKKIGKMSNPWSGRSHGGHPLPEGEGWDEVELRVRRFKKVSALKMRPAPLLVSQPVSVRGDTFLDGATSVGPGLYRFTQQSLFTSHSGRIHQHDVPGKSLARLS